MTANQPTATGSGAHYRQLEVEIRHDWTKVGIGVCVGTVVTLLVVTPGWDASHRQVTLPEKSTDLVAIGFGALPSVGSVGLRLDAQPLTQSETATLQVNFSVEQSEELSTKPTLVVSGAAAESLLCTGAGVRYRRMISLEDLSPTSKAAALVHAERRLREPEGRGEGGWIQPGDTEIMQEATRFKYSEVEFETDESSYKRSVPTGRADESKLETVHQRTISSKCTFLGGAVWASKTPDYQLRIPSMFVVMKSPPEGIELALSTSVPAMSGLALTQATYSAAADSQGGTSWSQSGKVSSNPFLEGQKNNYRTFGRQSIGGVFRSALEAQQEQARIFNSGIGLGVVSSMLVWLWPVVYDLIFIKQARLKRTKKELVPEPAKEIAPD